MIGNVWEWTTDWYSAKHQADAPKACCIPENPRGGAGGREATTPPPNVKIPRKVSKAARICARPTIAAAIARLRAMRSRSTLPQAMSAFRCIKRNQQSGSAHKRKRADGKSRSGITPNR